MYTSDGKCFSFVRLQNNNKIQEEGSNTLFKDANS